MVYYDKSIIDALLDSYERSVLFTGENKNAVRISFSFDKKSIPVYFDESSLAYEEIHSYMKNLEYEGLIEIQWKKGKENHIISKVILCLDKLEDAYAYVNRQPKSYMLRENLLFLRKKSSEIEEIKAPVCKAFLIYLTNRLEQGKTVKEYITLDDINRTEKIIECLKAIEQNSNVCYIREFSIRLFHDSKEFESLSGIITKIFHEFKNDCKSKNIVDILAEYGIYHMPNYVYFKGKITLEIGGEKIAVGPLEQGIGISGEDIDKLCFGDVSTIKKVITIENLTTFFRWQEEDCLILYLGGYHNFVRRKLLKKLYHEIPNVPYLHFGDIDAGGFGIYEDLCRKTQIPFQTYHMDIATLKQYESMGKRLTENDKKRIKRMIEDRPGVSYMEVLWYMLEKNIKVEQECILFDAKFLE